MQNEYSCNHRNTDRDTFPEIDREVDKQELIARYRCLKQLRKSDLTLEDQLFLENFQTAMRIFWGITLSQT
jgi:hypothetical protein